MNQTQSSITQIGFWAVLLIGVFAWAPATYPGYWQGLEGFLPVFNVTSNGPVADIGQLPDLWRGSGRGTFLLAQPLVALGGGAIGAVRLSFIIAFILGGLGTYIWLRPRFGDRSAGLAGLIYMLMPTFLATVYVRGSLGDALVMALFPVIMAGLQLFVIERSPSAIGVAVLSQLWLWRIQPGLALFVVSFAFLFILLVEQDMLTLLAIGMCTVAGLLSLWPYWSIYAPSSIIFHEHFVYFFQLFGNQWKVAPSIPGWQDGYPFQLGFVVWGFGLISLWAWWQSTGQSTRQPVGTHRFLWFMLGAAALLTLLSLELSNPLWQWSQAHRLLTYPWQILLIASLPLAVLAGAMVFLLPALQNPAYWAGTLAIVVLSSHPYLTTQFTDYQPNERPIAVYGARQEVLLLEAEIVQTEGEATAQVEIAWQALQPMDFDYNVFFQAIEDENGATNVVAQLDTQPVQGTRPATSWAVGEVITDTYSLDLSDYYSSGKDASNLQYHLGYYNWTDGSRLMVRESITGIHDNKLVLYGR
ncbi:MAG: hypothetical protein AAF702_33905 [Chloroflexota bacterium]